MGLKAYGFYQERLLQERKCGLTTPHKVEVKWLETRAEGGLCGAELVGRRGVPDRPVIRPGGATHSTLFLVAYHL